MVNLYVGTSEPDEDRHVFSLLSDIAGDLSQTHEYVSITSHDVMVNDEPDEEELTYDENTLIKVHEAIKEALAPYGLGGDSDNTVTDVISCLQNAGIYFREKVT